MSLINTICILTSLLTFFRAVSFRSANQIFSSDWLSLIGWFRADCSEECSIYNGTLFVAFIQCKFIYKLSLTLQAGQNIKTYTSYGIEIIYGIGICLYFSHKCLLLIALICFFFLLKMEDVSLEQKIENYSEALLQSLHGKCKWCCYWGDDIKSIPRHLFMTEQ